MIMMYPLTNGNCLLQTNCNEFISFNLISTLTANPIYKALRFTKIIPINILINIFYVERTMQ